METSFDFFRLCIQIIVPRSLDTKKHVNLVKNLKKQVHLAKPQTFQIPSGEPRN